MAEFSTDNVDLLYRGLVSLIENNTGVGFHNNDQGHPFYVVGAQGKRWEEKGQVADDGDSNELFLLIKKLTGLLRDQGADEFTWFREELAQWHGFCKFAVDSYNKGKGSGIDWQSF